MRTVTLTELRRRTSYWVYAARAEPIVITTRGKPSAILNKPTHPVATRTRQPKFPSPKSK